MRIKPFIFGIVLGAPIFATVPTQAAEDNPASIRLRTVETQVSADGRFTRTLHMEVQAANAAAAMDVGQQTIPFSEAMEELEIVEAYTAKADGNKIPIGPNAVYTQQPQGSTQYPLFDDERQKVIVFPSVGGGDTVIYTVKWRTKQAWIPGQFTYSAFYSRGIVYNDVRETIIAPKSMPLQVDNHEVEFEKQDTGDTITYRWHYSAPKATLEDLPRVSPLDGLPRFFVSSFKDYDAFGHAFATIISSKETVTPRIQSLAEQLTSGVRDRRQQAQKIYDWVSKNVRYVAVDIGNGGIVPHDADSVLANAYGDCKDHAVLFAALLKAKGIPSEPVLINLGSSYSLAGVPTLYPMNHAITWLPEFKTYADTTAGTAPFGVLPFEEYGKPVVHAIAAGSTRHEIPVLSPETATFNLKTVAKLDKDGKVTGNSVATAQGPFSITLRNLGLAVQGSGAARYAAAQLEKQGLVGSGSFDVSQPTEISRAYSLQTSFSYGPKPDYVSGVRFDMVRGLWLGAFAGDFLMGPLFDEKLKESEPTACFSGRIIEELSLEAPEGRVFSKLPDRMSLRTRNVQFSASWSVSRNTVTLRREFVSRIDQAICDGAVRRDTAKLFGDIRRHYNFDLVSLTTPNAVTLTVVLDVEALTRGVDSALRDRDWDSAIRLGTAAVAKLGSPPPAKEGAHLYGLRAFAYFSKRDYNGAIADNTQVLRLDPTDYVALVNRGGSYAVQKRFERADADFVAAMRINPKEMGAYNGQAAAHFDRGLFHRVIDDCGAALKLGPSAVCFGLRARVYYMLAEFDKAIADSNEAVKLAPQNADSFHYRGLSYLATEQYQKAIADFDAANKIAPNYAPALYARGVAKMRLGDDSAGDTDRAAASKLSQNIAYTMAGLGVSTSAFVRGVDDLAACKTADQNDPLQGLIYCTRTLAAPNLKPEDKAVAYGMLGKTYSRIGEPDEAITNLDTALQLNPTDAKARAARGLSYTKKGNNDKALDDLNAAVMLAPTDPEIRVSRGIFLAGTGDTTMALAEFDEAIKVAPDSIVAYAQRSKLYEESDQFDKAIADMNAVVRLATYPSSYAVRCYILAFADRLTAAMADCEKALTDAPNLGIALSARGLINLKLGQDAMALEDFERALTTDFRPTLAYYGRGLLKLKNGDASGNDDIAEAALIDADLVARMRRRGLRP